MPATVFWLRYSLSLLLDADAVLLLEKCQMKALGSPEGKVEVGQRGGGKGRGCSAANLLRSFGKADG